MNLKSVNPSKNVEQLKVFGYILRIFETFCACYLPTHTITIRPFYANVEVLQYKHHITPYYSHIAPFMWLWQHIRIFFWFIAKVKA